MEQLALQYYASEEGGGCTLCSCGSASRSLHDMRPAQLPSTVQGRRRLEAAMARAGE